jgi:hypothetical protein
VSTPSPCLKVLECCRSPGKGKLSIVIATAAPINASTGDTKTAPAKKAKKKPKSEPSRVLPLLNGNGFFEINPPKSEAVLSPKVNMAMAAPFTGAGKSNRVISMPRAKYRGAAANSYSSACDAALRVIARYGQVFSVHPR